MLTRLVMATPLLYKLGAYGDTHFLIFALKHRLWVLVRTASGSNQFLSKNAKNIRFFLLKIDIFAAAKYHRIMHRSVVVMNADGLTNK